MENKKKRRGMLAVLLGLVLTVCGGALRGEFRVHPVDIVDQHLRPRLRRRRRAAN